MPGRQRYAPSPTGDLHLGNLRTALLAWLAARRQEDTFILRVEDLDTPRVRPGATSRMLADLRWLGLDWEEGPDVGGPRGPYLQSRRAALYASALARLRAQGLVYPCFCSRAMLTRVASAPSVHDATPVYPGTCRDLRPAEIQVRIAAGHSPAWRVRVSPGTILFTDGALGVQSQDIAREVGDFIVRRSDGVIAYQLAVVVDDAMMGITQVVRGADLLDSTARQILLFQLLDWPVPRYMHVPLVTDASGAKLSKRARAEGIDRYRESGASAMAVVGDLAQSAGIWPPGTPTTPAALIQTAAWPWR